MVTYVMDLFNLHLQRQLALVNVLQMLELKGYQTVKVIKELELLMKCLSCQLLHNSFVVNAKKDIQDMYHTQMLVLIQQPPVLTIVIKLSV